MTETLGSWFGQVNEHDEHNAGAVSLKLTFENNQFVLRNAQAPSGRWSNHSDPESYLTTDLKSAAQFKRHGDKVTERIFNKLSLKSFDLPLGGAISPKEINLLPFQRERGVPHILSVNHSYLAHQPGLGKTAQAICAVNTKPGLATIYCPSFLKVTWAREITKWFAGAWPEIAIVKESAKQLETNWHADFLIVSDAMIQKDWVRSGLAKRKAKYNFVDEAHRYKEPGANRTVGLFGGDNGKIKSRGLLFESEHACLLSGTPLLGRAIELWPILYSMAPETIDFMTYEDFGMRYGGPTVDDRGRWQFRYSSNEAELNKRIMGRFMQHIKKADVLKDLPPKVREVIPIEEDMRAADVIQFDRLMLRKLGGGFASPKALGEYATIRHATGVSKVKWTGRFIHEILKNDETEQIILFAWHRDVVEGLADFLAAYKPEVIYGGIDERERTRIEDKFQSGRCRLIIGNIQAMNLGLTLTKATRVVFCEYDWTPSNNEQAEDRANRIGSEWSVLCQYLVLMNSMDEALLTSNILKKQRNDRIIA